MARTPKAAEDRREQIIDAAMRVFAQKGFTRATNKDIAREAGITPGLIYYYFTSKEDLLRALLEVRSPVQLMTSISPEMLALSPDIFLRMVLRQVLEIVESENFVSVIRVLLPEILHNQAISPIPLSFIQRLLSFLGGYLETQAQQGRIRHIDFPLTAQVLAGCVMGFVLRRQILQDPTVLQYTHEQIANTIVDTIIHGIEQR